MYNFSKEKFSPILFTYVRKDPIAFNLKFKKEGLISFTNKAKDKIQFSSKHSTIYLNYDNWDEGVKLTELVMYSKTFIIPKETFRIYGSLIKEFLLYQTRKEHCIRNTRLYLSTPKTEIPMYQYWSSYTFADTYPAKYPAWTAAA